MTIVIVRCKRNTRIDLHQAGVRAAHQAIRKAHFVAAKKSVRIRKDTLGRPAGLISGRRNSVAISISHSYPYALAAATSNRKQIGVDIERIRTFKKKTWEAFLTPNEKLIIGRATRQEQAFFRTLAWSIKEAVLKALGVGLRVHPNQLEIERILATSGHVGCIGIRGVPYTADVRFWRIERTHVAVSVAISATQGTIRPTHEPTR